MNVNIQKKEIIIQQESEVVSEDLSDDKGPDNFGAIVAKK